MNDMSLRGGKSSGASSVAVDVENNEARPGASFVRRRAPYDGSSLLTRPFGIDVRRLRQQLARWMRLRTSNAHASRSYRYLARQIEADLPRDNGGRTILFSSPAPRRLSNDAILMFSYSMRDELDCRILLVDGTFRDGGVAGVLGHEGAPGLLNLIYTKDYRVADLIKPTQRPNICFMPTGWLPANQLLPVQASRIADLIREARASFDYVLIQQGSIFEDTRYLLFASVVDLTLMFVAEGDTLVDELERCKNVFRDHQISNVRIVLSVPD